MIFLGCGCMWSCIRPSGRQCASGLSLLFSDRRAFTRSAAHGSIGRPSLNPEPMFLNVAFGGVPGGSSGGGPPLGPPFGPPGPPFGHRAARSAAAAGPAKIPDSREIGMAIGRLGRGRVELRLAVGRARDSGGGVIRPLGVRSQREQSPPRTDSARSSWESLPQYFIACRRSQALGADRVAVPSSAYTSNLEGCGGAAGAPERRHRATPPASASHHAATRRLRRSAGDRDVLFAVQHERHRRTHLREARGDVHELVAIVGAINDEPGVDAREHQIPGGGKRPALVKSCGKSSPAFLCCDRIPGDQDISAPFRPDRGRRRRGRTASSHRHRPVHPLHRRLLREPAVAARGRGESPPSSAYTSIRDGCGGAAGAAAGGGAAPRPAATAGSSRVPAPRVLHLHLQLRRRDRRQPVRYPYSSGRVRPDRCPSAEARNQDSPGTCSRRRWCSEYRPGP